MKHVFRITLVRGQPAGQPVHARLVSGHELLESEFLPRRGAGRERLVALVRGGGRHHLQRSGSRMAAFTLAASSGVISSTPWSFAACAFEQPQLGACAQVHGQRVAGRRHHGHPQQVIVDRLDEAGRTGQERRPRPVPLVQGRGDRHPLTPEQGPDRGRDLRGDDPPNALRVLAGQKPGLHLDLAPVKDTPCASDAGAGPAVTETADASHL